ncbi:MAG: hypothetical protein ACRCYU_14985 [Nocardioides sp.]
MFFGIADTRNVTITLSTTAVDAIRDLVATGRADSVSGFVQHAVQVSLDDVAGWGEVLAAALQETGGHLSSAERTWASEVLGTDKGTHVA